MKDEYFINEAFDEAIKLYIASSLNKDGLIYNSFLVIVIRSLILIYGEDLILNPYYLKDEEAFYRNLAIYGYNYTNIALFKEDLLNFYKEDIANRQEKYQKPILFFQNVMESLIDMFILKKKNYPVNYQEEEAFLDLIYINNVDPYRYSYKYLMDKDNFIEKYYYTKLNDFDITKTIKLNVPDITENYQVKEENQFLDNLRHILKDRKTLTTGNGYVDILLLMSVIFTSFSIISILIFSI